ncbi:MAG: 2-oxo acid dehydrogenase subunit E2 [Anaerolineae bacterium]|nr:2-oxo acid dehydrogenase subunit E2 [Anaerolineae bacterium]
MRLTRRLPLLAGLVAAGGWLFHRLTTASGPASHAGYTIKRFPKVRRLVVDTVRFGKRQHVMFGLLEVDVTTPRRLIHEHTARTGEKLSFTAFLIHCLGEAINRHPEVHAYRNWRDQVLVFDEVDASIIIEIEFEGKKFPLAHVLRGVNRRSLRCLHDEIRATQARPERDTSSGMGQAMAVFLRLPWFVRDLVYMVLYRTPTVWKQMIGSVTVTAIGMMGEGGGWGISHGAYNLALTVGGISTRLTLRDGEPEAREMLSLTAAFNHDVVDGAPATRFMHTYRELVAAGYGLAEAFAAVEDEAG